MIYVFAKLVYMATLKELREVRIQKLNSLKDLGINPYPPTATKDTDINTINTSFSDYKDKSVTLIGRIISIRNHGGLAFIDIQDAHDKIQLYIKKEDLLPFNAKEQILGFENIELLDIGDIVQAKGTVTISKANENSLLVNELKIIGKALLPLADKHFGLKDTEERYRKRYLDMIMNLDVKFLLDTRWKMTKEIRKFLWDAGFDEVETPILQPLYGGTNAKPFVTHLNALDSDFYLRIAPELYLKRLMVGGYEKIFEIAKNFRNEGIDQTHFPEFTMLEWYEAYADYHRVMDLAEALTKHLVKEVLGDTKIKVGDNEIDISGKWPRIPVEDLVKQHLNIDWETVSDKEVKDLLKKHKINIRGSWDKDKAIFTLYDHIVTPTLLEPTWVIDYPISISPLAKKHRSKDKRAERFEGYIGGIEIYDGWSEVVSGIEQRDRFMSEQQNMKDGDDESMQLDEDFIEALEHGCPPLGGIGFGIDRLAMFLTNTWAIKQVVAFPILKPKNDTQNLGHDILSCMCGHDCDCNKNIDSNKKCGCQSNDSGSHECHCGSPKKHNCCGGQNDDCCQNKDVTEFKTPKTKGEGKLPTREQAQQLLQEHVQDEYQKMHALMVATALEAYAKKLGEDEDLWYLTGLLHDLDYFEYPNEHPTESLKWFADWGYPQDLIHAVSAHAHSLGRTDEDPQTKLAWALIAVDELAGFLYAYSLMRPEGYEGMKASSIKKKFKDKHFAAKVDRDEIMYGVQGFDVDFGEHALFLVEIFKSMNS